MTVKIDEHALRTLVNEKQAKRVVFNAPDGLLSITREAAGRLESDFPGLESIIIADATYGSCDTVDIDAQRLGADLAFHVGHNIKVKKFGKITFAVDAFDDMSFDIVANLAAEKFKKENVSTVGVVAFAQHIREIERVCSIFEKHGITAIVGKGLGQLHDGQIFGCEFYPAYNIREKAQIMVLLGQSMFHAIGLRLSTGKPTYILDPYESEVIDVQGTSDERLKRAVLSIYKARDAEKFGVIIGLKEGQIMADQSVRIKRQLESLGKRVQLLALREITAERMDQFTDIQAFIQTGCPRISVDGYTFSKPVLSVPQTDALISLLSGKEIGMDLFERKNWL
ncbi:MAG: diphthamide biosynthesis enzyme Dph2 [Nitrososphaerales archaeon]